MRGLIIICFLLPLASLAQGPYHPPAGLAGSSAIDKNDTRIRSWASECSVVRGFIDITDKSKGKVSYGDPNAAVGFSDVSVVSLGDSGVATISFNGVVHNGPSWDFAIFENSFDGAFLEFAFVEVSSDGIRFVRFPAHSLTDTSAQVSNFTTLDATNVNNLAGKYQLGYGTPFDLEELKDSIGIDVDSIRYIRVVDVVGSINPNFGSRDSEGRLINDPYPTTLEVGGKYNGGFDLESVGLINYSGEIFLSENRITPEQFKVYPNPFNDHIHVAEDHGFMDWVLISQNGERIEIQSAVDGILPTTDVPAGLYYLKPLKSDSELGIRLMKL
jgi:hypothetical protein